jgi:hypothetical protein
MISKKILLLTMVFFIHPVGMANSFENKLKKELPTEGTAFFDRFGANYFSFWDGPNIEDGKTSRNEMDRPVDSGLSLFNLVSVTYKMTDRLALDLQNRVEVIHTNDREIRFEGMRVGISGELLRGDKWSLRGALNTDMPGLNGRTGKLRKNLFNPGTFAGLNYQINSRWSFYSILSPRVFFYSDDNAIEEEWIRAGRSAQQKPRLVLNAGPTINYALNDKTSLRGSLDLSFRQLVADSFGTLKRWPTTASIGVSHSFNKHVSIYPYILSWPLDGKKIRLSTTSVGMWINGVIF